MARILRRSLGSALDVAPDEIRTIARCGGPPGNGVSVISKKQNSSIRPIQTTSNGNVPIGVTIPFLKEINNGQGYHTPYCYSLNRVLPRLQWRLTPTSPPSAQEFIAQKVLERTDESFR